MNILFFLRSIRLSAVLVIVFTGLAPCLSAQPLPFSSAEETARLIKPFASEGHWLRKQPLPPLSRLILCQSLEAARAFYLNQQKTQGNFTYLVDLKTGKSEDDDNQVRQAGALWGLACLNKFFYNEPTKTAILNGFEFFLRNLKRLPTGEVTITYPGEKKINSGTIALFCLALTDFLEGQDKYLDQPTKDKLRRVLFAHIQFLRTMELDDGSWSRAYDIQSGIRIPVASPYYDGEALLAYCKVAKLYGRKDLLKRINEAIPKLIHKYTVEAWQPDGDEDVTKGFFQWGCMSFAEYVDAGWSPHAQLVSDAALSLAWWQLDDNALETKKANVAYAVEGLVAAWRIAKAQHDAMSERRIKTALDSIMARLLLCQYGGPFSTNNPFFSLLSNVPPEGFGGITAAPNSSLVRIDNVQHQVHATLMMLQFLYPEKP